ncbi:MULTISPECIES: glycosyltransferase family 4 protein [Psychrobacter]|uniref:glycosyltransferase family 4 protein n=1 Tax=Psychrobacter TaxID=497 RepID=UPI00146C51B2|nr:MULTISPECIES: glycosyltransferase family 4 protein [Psychrobacter]
MRVVIIGTIASSLYGFRLDLINELIAKGHQVFAFTCEYSADDLNKIKALDATPVTYQLERGGLNPLADMKATYALAKKIKDIAPDIVFSYFAKPVIFGTLAAKLAKVPKVIGMLEGLGYSFTEQPEGIAKKTAMIKAAQVLLYKVALPQLDTLIFLNPDDPKDLLDKYHIKVNQVKILGGIGLNLENYSYSDQFPNCPTFIFIARLLAEKGIHDYLAAAKIVQKQYPDAKFTVLGSIDKEAQGALTEDELQNVISSGIITYPGHVDNVADWIADSSVFVLPSYYREGVPRSTQEAMAIGRPIITTDVPGCRETVVDGENGFLVAKWNPQAIADKMIYFIENPEQIQKMGEVSYQMAQDKFDARKVNARLLAIMGV